MMNEINILYFSLIVLWISSGYFGFVVITKCILKDFLNYKLYLKILLNLSQLLGAFLLIFSIILLLKKRRIRIWK